LSRLEQNPASDLQLAVQVTKCNGSLQPATAAIVYVI
jgi:hypothetical protein